LANGHVQSNFGIAEHVEEDGLGEFVEEGEGDATRRLARNASARSKIFAIRFCSESGGSSK
jgi:hypothetical protein